MGAKPPLSDSAHTNGVPRSSKPSSRRHAKKPHINYGPSHFIPEAEVERTPDENEFMLAVDRYKREVRANPTWDQVLDVLHALGYRINQSAEAAKFSTAIGNFKNHFKRQHPTWTEVLGVALRMGYRKTEPVNPEQSAIDAEEAYQAATAAARHAQTLYAAAIDGHRSAQVFERAAAKQKDMARQVSLDACAMMEKAELAAKALRAAVPADEPELVSV